MADNALSADAVPEESTPQGSIDESQIVYERQNVAELNVVERDIHIPTVDWSLNHLLVKLDDQITAVELEKMKVIFSGDGGIGRRVLSEVKTSLQLFDLLKTRCWLTRDNLLSLQAALKTIGRMDLVKTAAVEYAQHLDNVLHFYPASDQPEIGNRSVKLHICGHNYRTTNRDDIQQIRAKFAELLFAPLECIIIAGIEPATSLIVTLQIPELYAELLIDMLETNADQSRFKDICIDRIEIQQIEGLFHLLGTEKATTLVREPHNKLYNVYQQLEKTKKQLEANEIEQLQLKNRLEEFEKKSFAREVAFEKTLQRPELKSFDKALIPTLIDINTKVVANAVSDGYKLMEEEMRLAIKEQEENLQISDKDSIEKMILENFRNLVEAFRVSYKETKQVDEQFIQSWKKISQRLRYQEREKLEKNFNWAPNDTLKLAMDNDSSFFLAGILQKKIQTTNALVEPELFIQECLETVGRSDLKIELTNLCSLLKAPHSAA